MTSPFFSLAINQATSGPAGYFVIGGLPPVAHDDFTTVPIELESIDFGTQKAVPTFLDYLVNVTGFSVNGKAGDTGSVKTLQMVVSSPTIFF